MSDYQLRLLDPSIDRALYETAYQWRSKPKKHVQPDRMPLKDFLADDPRHLTIGLFNGELQAVYFLDEFEPTKYEAHFSSRRDVSRETLLSGASTVASLLLSNGATEICAWVTKRNTPLRSFLESLGFTPDSVSEFPCQEGEDSPTLHPERNQRIFVRYSLKRTIPPFP